MVFTRLIFFIVITTSITTRCAQQPVNCLTCCRAVNRAVGNEEQQSLLAQARRNEKVAHYGMQYWMKCYEAAMKANEALLKVNEQLAKDNERLLQESSR